MSVATLVMYKYK